ncbi:MAG: pilus assembly protein TadG-related protein [Anaerolineales bacterium]|nr:pilus assembly protein TadG-related protein [Anaerolineales bacterium]
MELATFLRSERAQKGQLVLAFVVLFPVFIVCLFIVTDMGRLLALKNQVRIAADSAALAAAGALDMDQAGYHRNFVLNDYWATVRANDAITTLQARDPDDDWMTYGLSAIDVDGSRVTVIVTGTGETLFGGYLGYNTLSANAISHARAAVGVDREW